MAQTTVVITDKETNAQYRVPVNHPDGATPAEIQQMAQQFAAKGGIQEYENRVNPPLTPMPPPANYGERMVREYAETDFRKPFEEFGSEVDRRTERYQTSTQELTGAEDEETRRLRMGGAGRLTEAAIPVSQAARVGGETLVAALKPLVPLSVRNFLGHYFDEGMQSEVTQEGIQYLISSEKKFYEWAAKNPQEAEALKSAIRETMGTTFDFSALFTPRPDLINLDRQLAHANQKRLEAGHAKITKRQQATSNQLEPPHLSTRDKTEKSASGTEVWMPDDFGMRQVEALEAIPKYNPYGSFYDAMRVTQNYVAQQKKRLDALILKQNKPIEMNFVNSKLAERLRKFKESDVYLSTPEASRKYWDDAIATAQQVFASESADLVGVLNARRRFDRTRDDLGISQDPTVATAQAQANRAVRGALNDVLKAATDGTQVHDLLDNQHRILTAMDTLNFKRNKEARNWATRTLDAIAEHTGGLGRVSTSIIGIAATGATLMSPMYGGIAAGVLGGGYVALQVQRYGKAATLKAYGETVGLINKAIRTVSDPTKVEALELDRLLLIELMNGVREYEEPSENEQ